MCWDEKTQALTNAPINKMAPGVSWIYNWAVAPTGSATNIGQGDGKMAFLPMCWNASFDETALRNYLTQHQGEVQYLLAFNEPNLAWNVGGAPTGSRCMAQGEATRQRLWIGNCSSCS